MKHPRRLNTQSLETLEGKKASQRTSIRALLRLGDTRPVRKATNSGYTFEGGECIAVKVKNTLSSSREVHNFKPGSDKDSERTLFLELLGPFSPRFTFGCSPDLHLHEL